MEGAESDHASYRCHIKVDTRKAIGCESMHSIRHELQHALEVLGNPNVVDYHTFARCYMRKGVTADDTRFATESTDRVELLVENGPHARSMCNR
jgi:hypothetical protein